MKLIYYTIIITLFTLVSCGEKDPVFHPELTESATPVEGVLPFFNTELMNPYWPINEKYPDTLRKIPEKSFVSHEGKNVTGQNLLGKYKLIVFFYAKCNGICPMVTRTMVNFLPKIEDQTDIEMISITVNPEVDDVAELNKYRNIYKITQQNWIFLTGDQKSIFEIARQQFGAEIQVVAGKDNLNDFVHTENVYLIDKQNYLRGVYRAKGPGDLERLLVELKTLKNSDKFKL